MTELSKHIGSRIKLYRKQKNLSTDELAKYINKSKSTVSKYENGVIVIDIETLFDIAKVLGINVNQLIDYKQNFIQPLDEIKGFFSNNNFYIYFFDGRKKKITKGYMTISNSKKDVMLYMGINSFHEYLNCDTLYYGQIEIHDIVTNLSLKNQANEIERMNLIAINPINNVTSISSLMIGISGNPFIPAAIKCVISLNILKEDDELLNFLILNKDDFKLMKKYNFFTNQRIL